LSGRSTSSESDHAVIKDREREKGRTIDTSELTFSPGSLQAARRATGNDIQTAYEHIDNELKSLGSFEDILMGHRRDRQ
jgi:hypothetical protein